MSAGSAGSGSMQATERDALNEHIARLGDMQQRINALAATANNGAARAAKKSSRNMQLECGARLCKTLPPRILLPLQGTLRDFMMTAAARARNAHTSSVAELTKQMVEQALRGASAAAGQACSWGGSAAGIGQA
jgi:hypothetical protein